MKSHALARPPAVRAETLVFQMMLFFGTWMLRVISEPMLASAAGAGLAADLASPALRVLIWIVPAAAYVAYGLHLDPLRHLKLSTDAAHGLLWGAALAGVLLVLNYTARPVTWRELPGWPELLDLVVVAALAEEILFRGYVLQRLLELTGFWRADIATALLSTLIRWPRWLLLRGDTPDVILVLSVPVFAVALIAGYLVRRSNSLWPAILLQASAGLLQLDA